jgi:hypothetical protein
MSALRFLLFTVRPLKGATDAWDIKDILILVIGLVGVPSLPFGVGWGLLGFASGVVSGFAALSLCLAVLLGFAGIRLQAEKDRAGDHTGQALARLRDKSYRLLGGGACTSLELFKFFQNVLRVGVTQHAIQSRLEEITPNGEYDGGTFQKVSWAVADEICQDWTRWKLVANERVDPAPGSASSVRISQHDLPYTRYVMQELGFEVVNRLEQDED